MTSLASKAKHVPFRNSKLTRLLEDSLSGQAKSMMFIHVAPEVREAQESRATHDANKPNSSSWAFLPLQSSGRIVRGPVAARKLCFVRQDTNSSFENSC